jgi:hypothetical protein
MPTFRPNDRQQSFTDLRIINRRLTMTAPSAPRDYNRFALVPIYADSTGREAVPQNALFVGSQSAVMERILDSKARREALTLINDADKVRKEKAALRADRAEFEADKAAFAADVDAVHEVLLNEFVSKLDALAARMDSLEAERARDPEDDELPLPPGSPAPGDSGELETPKASLAQNPVAIEDN